LRRERKLC